MEKIPVEFDYVNHRGIRRRVRAIPIELWYGSNKWYPAKQHLLKAEVPGKGERNFAMAKVSNWSAIDDE
jgi:hypothetical protein